jgi:hypothetical protein
MTGLLLAAMAATAALAVAAAWIAHHSGLAVRWRRVGVALAAEYGVGVLIGAWPLDAVLAPARALADRLLVGGA